MKLFQAGESIIFDSRGKVKNNDKELVAHVKALVDEDACVLLEEIVSALNFSLGSASSTLHNRLSYHKVCPR